MSLLTEIDVVPELPLRDRSQRPGGIDIQYMPTNDRYVGREIELDSIHPFDVAAQGNNIGERRVAIDELRSQQARHHLHGHGRYVVVRLKIHETSLVLDGYLPDRTALD